jgi:hypothetical protein
MEPFLLVRGRLQKDGRTMNVIATLVRTLRTEPTEGSPNYLAAMRADAPGIKSFQ